MQDYIVYRWNTNMFAGYEKVGTFPTIQAALEFVNGMKDGFPYRITLGGVLLQKIKAPFEQES